MYKFGLSAAVAALALGLGSPAAFATDGYFQDGYGARQKALGGAGVADSRDATAIANNPAGLVDVDDQTTVSLSLFSPQRSYEAGPYVMAMVPQVLPGEHGSDSNLFGIPNVAWTHRLSPNTVLGIGMYGNGGMNTRYPDAVYPFGHSPTGVDMNQAFMSVGLSHRMGRFSFGVAPILAVQTFKAYGLGGFAGYSVDPNNVSDNSFSLSYGGGVRAGVQYDIMPNVRIGVAGNSRVYMTEFDHYKGLFAERGDFDIPASVTAGVAVDVRPNLTVMFDYKRIFYSDVASIGNPSASLLAGAKLGADNGPGFGWHDINIFKVGAEWRYNPIWTFRAGYSYNDSPVKSADVMFNILAPAVVQHHITSGVKYKWSDNLDLELAAVYVPESSVKGTDLAGVGQDIEIKMHQYEGTFGIVYHWDGHRDLEPLK